MKTAAGVSNDYREQSTPWAITWLTWPTLFAFNVGLALLAISRRGHYASVLTTLLITDVVVLVTLEFLFPVRRQWKMTWRSSFRDLKYIVAGGATFAVIDGLFGLAAIRLNTGRVGPISDWPLYVSVPAALLAVEFLNYWQHRWSHELNGSLGGFFWRSHAAHHLPDHWSRRPECLPQVQRLLEGHEASVRAGSQSRIQEGCIQHCSGSGLALTVLPK